MSHTGRSVRSHVALALIGFENAVLKLSGSPASWLPVLDGYWRHSSDNMLDDWDVLATEMLPEYILEKDEVSGEYLDWDEGGDAEAVDAGLAACLRELYEHEPPFLLELLHKVWRVAFVGVDGARQCVDSRSELVSFLSLLQEEGINIPSIERAPRMTEKPPHQYGDAFDPTHLRQIRVSTREPTSA